MAVNTQPNVSLVVSLDGVDYACQVIDASWNTPSVGASTITETACPDGVVGEPGSKQSGSLTGNVFTDTSPTGITRALIEAQESDLQITYIYTIYPGTPNAVQWDGLLRVASLTIDHAKPGVGKHALDLEILTAESSYPAAARTAGTTSEDAAAAA